MSAFKHLLTQTRRCYFSDPPPPRHLTSLFRRAFSSESEPPSIPEPNPNVRTPIIIQPVSYPTKPKPEPRPEPEHESPPVQQNEQNFAFMENTSPSNESKFSNLENRSWTRDDMRYMKDSVTPISPVSYASKVAPLPEDRVRVEADRNEDLERERRSINEDRWNAERRNLRKEQEEDVNLPFPRPIKEENADQNNNNKKTKVLHDLKEAIRLVKAGAKVTFDETLEAHVKMTPDLKRTDLKLSAFVRFPHKFGEPARVAVFAEGAAADEARDAGAEVVGGPDLVDAILTGKSKINVDACIATPSMMQHVKKLAKKLKGLMPDPKKKGVTNDVARAVKETKEQGAPFKKDKTAIVHLGVGKLSFTDDVLRENIGAFVNALLLAKPAGLKKSSKFAGYVESFHICSTMGSSFHITTQSVSMAADRYNRLQLGVQPESA